MSLSDLVKGWEEMEAALPGYVKAENYAENRISEVFAIRDARLAAELNRVAEEYRFNLIHIPITARCDRMEITSVKVPDDDAATQKLQEIWDANDMAVHYPDLIEKSLKYGDSYLMGWPLDDEQAEYGDDDAEDDAMVLAGVELTVHNPKNTRVFYDPEHPRRKAYAIFRWPVKNTAGEEVWRADVWYPDTVEHYVSENDNPSQESGWALFEGTPDDPHSGIEDNPEGEIPFFHHRTALPYGKPVHRFGYGPQNALNKMLITQLTTTDSQGWPQRYKLLRENAELDNADDAPQWLDDDDAVVTQPGGEGAKGGESSQMRDGAGTVHTYSGVEEVGQFAAADPAVFMDPAQVYIRLMATTTNTPLHDFDPSGDMPSGESLKTAEAPLVKDVERLITLQRGPVEEEQLFALKLAGVTVKKVEAKWAPVRSANGLDDWLTVKAKQDAGVPVDQTLTEAGYEAEEVDEWAVERERKAQEEQANALAMAQARPVGVPGAPAPAKAPAKTVVPKSVSKAPPK